MTLWAQSDVYLAFWTITVGAVCAVTCAVLGCFLVLRRMSLLGDAIAHGMLPGIAAAVIFTGQVSGAAVFAGAMLCGLLTAFLAQTLTSFTRVAADSSLGIVFTTLFAVGIVLIRFVGHRDVDPNCIFYGELDYAPLRGSEWLGWRVPDAFPGMLQMLAATLVFVALFWKELKLASFDPALATAMGFSAVLIHYLLIGLVAGAAVASFSALGAVIVLAMFIVPAATAQLLAERLLPMLFWSAGLALTSAVLGYVLASRWFFESNTGGMMATVAGAQLLLAALFAPRHGLIAKALRLFRLTVRMASEEILARLFREEELRGAAGARAAREQLTHPENEHGFSMLTNALAIRRLLRKGLLQRSPEGAWELTAAGTQEAMAVVRGHRLWETYLTQHFDLPLDHVHAPASRVEHFLGPETQSALARELAQPAVDPHGKTIPAAPPLPAPQTGRDVP